MLVGSIEVVFGTRWLEPQRRAQMHTLFVGRMPHQMLMVALEAPEPRLPPMAIPQARPGGLHGCSVAAAMQTSSFSAFSDDSSVSRLCTCIRSPQPSLLLQAPPRSAASTVNLRSVGMPGSSPWTSSS